MIRFHCFFEQSGTFKNEFKKLGYQAFDYDILNMFSETDYVIDLFNEVLKAYDFKDSIFDNILSSDMILAFFPCVRFENQIQMAFRGTQYQMRNWNMEKKLDYCMKLHKELAYYYEIISKLVIVCIRKNIPLIIENPFSSTHYLVKYWPISAKLIDNDRTKRGDFYRKPTQYFFINCEPKNNSITEKVVLKERKTISHTSNKVQRSMISSDYANRFIREFIL